MPRFPEDEPIYLAQGLGVKALSRGSGFLFSHRVTRGAILKPPQHPSQSFMCSPGNKTEDQKCRIGSSREVTTGLMAEWLTRWLMRSWVRARACPSPFPMLKAPGFRRKLFFLFTSLSGMLLGLSKENKSRAGFDVSKGPSWFPVKVMSGCL